MKHECSNGNKVQNGCFQYKDRGQGHKVMNLDVILTDFISSAFMAMMQSQSITKYIKQYLKLLYDFSVVLILFKRVGRSSQFTNI